MFSPSLSHDLVEDAAILSIIENVEYMIAHTYYDGTFDSKGKVPAKLLVAASIMREPKVMGSTNYQMVRTIGDVTFMEPRSYGTSNYMRDVATMWEEMAYRILGRQNRDIGNYWRADLVND